MKKIIVVAFIFCNCSFVFAQSNEKDNQSNNFAGHFTGGVSLILNSTNEDNIKEASIYDGIVVVKETENFAPKLGLNANWVLDKMGCLSFKWIKPGIYSAITVTGDKNLITSFSSGVMFSFMKIPFKEKTSEKTGEQTKGRKNSINFGFGYSRSKISTFADGIVAGKQLPENFDDIVMHSKWVNGLSLKVSFGVF